MMYKYRRDHHKCMGTLGSRFGPLRGRLLHLDTIRKLMQAL